MGLPTITTERLVLRPFDPTADAAAMADITSDPATMLHLAYGRPWTTTEIDEMFTRHTAQYPGGLGFGAVVDRATGVFAGWCGLQHPKRWIERVTSREFPVCPVEVGWTLGPEWRGRGYATEAANAWLAYGFETLGLDEIISVHDPENTASERVMDRLGMGRREMLGLMDDEQLCLHVVTRNAWESALRGARTVGVT
jgi:ribosomal-protein-alanine N-acetyltransferase